jgi:hypothetical protein
VRRALQRLRDATTNRSFMDLPLAGLGVFGGWVVLVVAGDVFGILRIPQKRLTNVLTAFLVVSLAAAIACGYFYFQEKHGQPCPPAHQRR